MVVSMKQRTFGLALILILLASGPAMAIKKGRLIGKVLDPEGNPIEGVTVTATCEEVPSFNKVVTTNKKGIFKLDFTHVDVVYRLVFEKNGYLTFESEQDWHLEGTARDDFTMYPGNDEITQGPVLSTSTTAISAFNQGVTAFNDGDYDTAEERFKKALEEDPELYPAWGGLARVHLKRQEFAEAVSAAEKAIELGSSNEETWRVRWEGYRGLGDEEKAIEALEDLKQAGLRAEEAKRIYNEGVALVKQGDAAGAYEHFRNALKVDPNLTPALVAMATVALELGHYAEAEEGAETILKSDPENEKALRIRYNAALNLADEDLIIDALVGLAAIEPKISRDSLLKLAFESYDANDMDGAEKRFLKVLEVDPDHALSHYLLGLIYVGKGENEQAKVHIERFLQLAPDDPEAGSAAELLKFLNGQ